MKKFTILASLLLATTMSFAQIELNSVNNVGIGIAPNLESKLSMQTASKYGMYLTNTGITGSGYNPGGTAYGIYATTTANGYGTTVYGLYADNFIGNGYGGSLHGIRMNNVRQGGYHGILHGMYLSNVCNSSTGEIYGVSLETTSSQSIPVYGVYSWVAGASAADTYSGLFTGGKLLVENNIYATLDVYARNVKLQSDERLKRDIKPLSIETNKLYQLQGKSYKKVAVVVDLQDSLSIALRAKHTRETVEDVAEFGYLAQELQEIFPELVSKDDATGYYAVNYIGLIPIIVEALKEQRLANEQKQAQIDTLQEMLQNLSNEVKMLKNR